MAAYYAKRADAGSIITEATIVSPLAGAFPNTPGIFNQKQMKGWKQVTKAIHDPSLTRSLLQTPKSAKR